MNHRADPATLANGHAGGHVLAPPDLLMQSMQIIRKHLSMDVAFISEFADGRRVFRYLDATSANPPIRVGGSDPLEESYCLRVVDGRLPELMTDACQNAEALTIPATRALNIGAHMSVPIRMADGQVFGTFCCFSMRPNEGLVQQDLVAMRILADVMAEHFGREQATRNALSQLETRIDQAFVPGHMRPVFQPIFDLLQGRAVGYEALTRFDCDPPRAPDLWFNEAMTIRRGVELELRAIELQLENIGEIPQGIYLTLNASPNTILDGRLPRMLAGYPLGNLVLEVTEHDEVEQYSEIARIVDPMRTAGLRVAVDDAGAGFACFKHILNLAPDIIKLDNSITRHIDTDASRQALAAALARFAETTHGKLVAEGVETAEELSTLHRLGIGYVQGFSLCRPGPLKATLELAGEAAERLKEGMASHAF